MPPKRVRETPKTLLVMRFSALGDVAMTVPAIYSLARLYPETRIIVATRPFFAGIFINPPENVELFPVDLKGEYRGIGGLWKLIKRLRAFRPDAVADLHNVLRTWVISAAMRLGGCQVEMVDKMRARRRDAFSGGREQTPYEQRYLDVFRRLGFGVSSHFHSVFDGCPATELPIEVSHPAVGIAPFARYETKIYPAEQMREVVRRLNEQGITTYLFGARGAEAEELKKWEGERCVSLAGKYPLATEMRLMAAMDMMVSMDSANQHLAALSGVPVATLWGSTSPACGFEPFGAHADHAIILGLPCQPCTVAGSKDCKLGHFSCFRMLTPEMVTTRILTLLKPKK